MVTYPALSLSLLLTLTPGSPPPEGVSAAWFLRVDGTLDARVVANLEWATQRALATQLGARALRMDLGLQDYERDNIPEARKTGAERMARARQLADELETVDALATAESAVDPLGAALVEPEDAQVLARCHGLLVNLALQGGDRRKAEDHARRAHLLDPELAPDPAAASPDELDLWKKVTTAMDKLPEGQLSVEVEPAGTRVVINGREVGMAPVTVPDLKPGTHVVRLSRPGFTPVVVPVHIKSKSIAKVKQNLAPTAMAQEVTQAIMADPLDPKATGPWVGRVATWGVDHAVVVVALEKYVDGSSPKQLMLAAHLVKLSDGTRVRRVSRATEDADHVEGVVSQLIQDVLAVDKGAGIPGPAAMVWGEKEKEVVAEPPPVEPVTPQEPVAATKVPADEPQGKGGFPVLPVVGGVLAAGVGAGVILALAAGVVAGTVVTAVVVQSSVANSSSSASGQEGRAPDKRERARRLTTMGY